LQEEFLNSQKKIKLKHFHHKDHRLVFPSENGNRITVGSLMLIPLNSAGCSDLKRPLIPIETGHISVGAKRRWG